MYSLSRCKIKINNNLALKLEDFSFDQGFRVISKNETTKNIIDRLVMEIAEIGSKKVGVDLNESNISIEYWCKHFIGKNAPHNLHYDKNEEVINNLLNLNYKLLDTELYPLCTMVYYFDDVKDPFIITNLEKNNNLQIDTVQGTEIYPCPNDQPVISYIFPRKNELVIFQGGKFLHGSTFFSQEYNGENHRRIIAINIWSSSYHKNRLLNSALINDKDTYYLNSNFKLEKDEKVIEKVNFMELNNIVKYTNDKNMISKILQNRTFKDTFETTEFNLANDFQDNIYSLAYSLASPFTLNKEFDFHLITVSSDEEHPGYKDFIETVKTNNIPHTVLGLNVEWKGTNMEGPGGGQKINLLKGELSSWNKDKLLSTIVLFTDSYDVLVFGNAEEIKRKYFSTIKKYNQINTVLFAAETMCWPVENLSKYYKNHFNSSYLYLNSGSFIGTGNNIYSLINDSQIADWEDDQLYYTQKFLNVNFKRTISIDYTCRLFQTLNNSLSNINFCSKGLHNMAHNSRPLILHGNGDKEVKEKLRFLYNCFKKGFNKIKYKNHSYLTFQPLYEIHKLNVSCYIITLKKNVKRRELMKKKIKRNTGIVNYKYYYGVDGLTDLNSYQFKVKKDTNMLVGEIGCFLSHYNLWLELSNKTDDYFLILEDDNTFYYNFNYYMNRLLTEYLDLLEEYDIIKCDNRIHAAKSFYLPINKDINKVNASYNSNCYIITKRGINKIINSDCINNIGPIDIIMTEYLNVATFKYAISDQEPTNFIKSEINETPCFNNYLKK